MAVMIKGSVAGVTVDAVGSDGGDGFYYFVCNGIYRVKQDDSGYCEKLMEYYQLQRWVKVQANLSSGSWDGEGGNGSIAGNKDVEAAVKWAIAIAGDNSHGYDQRNRWGPDYDCSSLVYEAFRVGGGFNLPVHSGYTGSMVNDFTKVGFKWLPNLGNTQSGLLRGDILLNTGSHTEIYIGSGMNVGAHSNEFGGITGGKPGDQSGREISQGQYYSFPWNGVLRYVG